MIGLYFRDTKILQSIHRYLKYTIQNEDVIFLPLDSNFRQKYSFDVAMKCDLLILEAFYGSRPLGFKFAKGMKKNSLLIQCTDKILIDPDGPCWLTLPEELPKFFQKVKYCMTTPTKEYINYKELESRFPILKDRQLHQ